MRFVLNLNGPDFEVGVNGDNIIFSANGSSISFHRKQLGTLLAQLSLVGQLIDTSGAAAAPALPAPPTPAPEVVPTPVTDVVAALRQRRASRETPAQPVATASGAAAPEPPEAAPLRRRGRPAGSKNKSTPAGAGRSAMKLSDHLHKYLTEKGPAHLDELISHVRKRGVSKAARLKLAVTIAMGRDRKRFQDLGGDRWQAI
jgi:hypothetical protein